MQVFWGTDDGRDNNNPVAAQDADMYRRLYATLRLAERVRITHVERALNRDLIRLAHKNRTLVCAGLCHDSALS